MDRTQAEFGHADIDSPMYEGASTLAQQPPVRHNPRYGHPARGKPWAQLLDNHAEQTILGDIADKLDDFHKGRIQREQIAGTVKMTVDQRVCNACRQGFASGSAGIIKQFSDEFPNVTVMITNTQTFEILVVKAGKLLIRGT